MTTCSLCRGPFHIATGELVSDMRGTKEYPLCGRCVHGAKRHYSPKDIRGADDGLSRFLKAHLSRKWGGGGFYANANLPPPAVEKTYVFKVYERVPGTTCTYRPTEVEKSGVTFEEALARLTETHPHHTVAEHTRGLWKEK